jgi:hypothetical protein
MPVSRRDELRRKAPSPLPELTGKLVGASNRVGFLMMDPSGADQGRLPEGATQIEVRTL